MTNCQPTAYGPVPGPPVNPELDKPSPIIGHPLDQMMHRLWGKACGTPSYDKQQWIEFERLIHKAILSQPEESQP